MNRVNRGANNGSTTFLEPENHYIPYKTEKYLKLLNLKFIF